MNKKSVLVLLSFIVLAIIIVVGAWFFKSSQSGLKSAPRSISLTKTSNPHPQDLLEKDIKATFTSSKDRNIIDYINLAIAETNADAQYALYVKAFNEMISSYKQTKDPRYRIVILELKNYLKVYPQYKEGSFVVPK